MKETIVEIDKVNQVKPFLHNSNPSNKMTMMILMSQEFVLMRKEGQ